MASRRILLSGSTNGRPVKIAATSSAGTTVHTATSALDEVDSIFLWLTNTDSSARTVTVQWGGTSDPDDSMAKTYTIAANSAPTQIALGQTLNGGVVVKVFASVTNVVLATGYVVRFGR